MKNTILKNLKILSIAMIVFACATVFSMAVSGFVNTYPVGTNPDQIKSGNLAVNALSVGQSAMLNGTATLKQISASTLHVWSDVNLNGILDVSNGDLYVDVKAPGILPVKLCADPAGKIIKC